MSQSALHLAGYIDAGTGSYLLAAVAGGAAGIWFYIRSKFAKLTGRGKSASDSTGTVENAADDSAPADGTAPSTETAPSTDTAQQ